MTSAAIVFAQTDYRQASLTDIAALAQTTERQVMSLFTSKAGIAHSVIDAYRARGQRLIQAASTWELDAIDRIARLCRSAALALVNDPFSQAGLNLIRHPEFRRIGSAHQEWISCVTGLVAAGHLDGSIAKDTEAESTARVLVSSFLGIDHVSARHTLRSDLLQRTDEWWTWVRPSLGTAGVGVSAPGRYPQAELEDQLEPVIAFLRGGLDALRLGRH